MNRIFPEQVIEALENLGIKAIQNAYYKDDCACGLGAVYANLVGYDKTVIRVIEAGTMLNVFGEFYGESYVDGFIGGFDGVDVWEENKDQYKVGHSDGWEAVVAKYKVGHADGKAAWEAVVAKGLAKE